MLTAVFELVRREVPPLPKSTWRRAHGRFLPSENESGAGGMLSRCHRARLPIVKAMQAQAIGPLIFAGAVEKRPISDTANDEGAPPRQSRQDRDHSRGCAARSGIGRGDKTEFSRGRCRGCARAHGPR